MHSYTTGSNWEALSPLEFGREPYRMRSENKPGRLLNRDAMVLRLEKVYSVDPIENYCAMYRKFPSANFRGITRRRKIYLVLVVQNYVIKEELGMGFR